MEFRILGPLEVRDGERDVPVGHGHERELLLYLLIRRNRPVPADVLVEALWRGDPPASAAKMLQVYVARLRRRLDPQRIETVGGGYRIRIANEELDASRFERLLESANAATESAGPRHVVAALDEALGLWRGEALADLRDDDFARAETARLEELRLAAQELRLEAQLRLGENIEVVSESEALVRQHPYRETLRRQQAIALYRAGRPTEALDAVRRAYADLDALGLEPGPALRDLEGAILRHDESLLATGGDGPPAQENAPEPRALRLRLAIAAAAIGALGVVLAIAVSDRGDAEAGLASVPAGSVGVVDVEDRIVSAIPIAGDPGPVAVSGRAVWVGTRNARTLTRIDAVQQRVVRVVGLPAAAYDVAASAVAAWTANGFEGTVTRVIADGDGVTGPIRVTPRSQGKLALATAGGALWVASTDDVVTCIDQTTLRARATVRGLENPDYLAAGEGAIWALERGRPRITRIDARSGAILQTIRLPEIPTAAAAGEGALWVLVPRAERVLRVDPRTGRTDAAIEVGANVASIATGLGFVWMGAADGTLHKVDPLANRVVSTLQVADAIAGLAVGGGHVWVSVPD